MNWTQIYLDTFIPEFPGILNANFTSFESYLDTFYDGSRGILIKPLETTGNVKGAQGEFVTGVFDNLIVKRQYTNLYENITIADYDYYVASDGSAFLTRDPCIFNIDTSLWNVPYEPSGYRVIDVNEPYYKISNRGPIFLGNDNISQIVGIIFDSCIVSEVNDFQILLDPSPSGSAVPTLFDIDSSSSGGLYIELIATDYDASWGSTWTQYKPPFISELSNIGDVYVSNASDGQVLVWRGEYWVAEDVSGTSVSVSDVVNAVDAVDTSLVTYTDAAIVTALDSSFALYETILNLDSSFGDVHTELNQLDASISRIDAYQLIQDNSIAAFEANDVTFDYVDGSISAAVDAVDTSLVTYTDAAIVTALDSSFALYETILNLDSSFGDVHTELNQLDASVVRIDAYQIIQDTSIAAFEANDVTFSDVSTSVSLGVDAVDTSLVTYTDAAITAALDSSFALYETILNLDTSFGLYETKVNIDSSISNIILEALSDVSITGITDGSSLIYEADGAFWTYGTGGGAGSTTLAALTDTSISSVTAEDILQYNIDTSMWENVVIVDASDYFLALTGGTLSGDLILDASLQFGDADTGIYKKPDDILSFIAGGVEGMRIDTSAFGGNTRVIVSPSDVGVSTGLYFGDGDTGIYESADDVLRITNLGDPQDSSDAVNRYYVDSSITGYTYSQAYIDGSLNAKAEGITQAYVDGSIVVAVAAVDTSLVAYTDAAIVTALDSSLALYETILNLDSSFGLYETILNLDSSFGLYETILNLDSSFALYETKVNIDSSISNIILGALSDVSITGITDGSSLIYEADGAFWTYGTGGGAGATTLVALTDTSIGTNLADNDFLQYNVDTSMWENVSPLEASTYFQEKIAYGTTASNATGTPGDWTYDASYLYVCSSDNFWIRIVGEPDY